MKKSKLTPVISWCIFLYFIILFSERVQSMARMVYGPDGRGLLVTGFDTYVDLTACISLFLTLVLLLFFNRGFFKSLFSASAVPDHRILSITAGIALMGGMVHTENTIAPLQFAAYGALILGMILRTVQTAQKARNRFTLWYSLAYLTVFSMSIPVMYRSHIEYATLFHIIEAVTAAVLVVCFTYMLMRVLEGKAEDLLFPAPIVIMAVLDAVVIGMRWNEEVNTFALIFAVLAAVMFVIGKLLFRSSRQSEA